MVYEKIIWKKERFIERPFYIDWERYKMLCWIHFVLSCDGTSNNKRYITYITKAAIMCKMGVYWRKNVKGLYTDNLLTTKIHVDIFWRLCIKSISHVYCFLDLSIHWTTYWNVLRKENKILNHISKNFTILLAVLMSLSLSPLLADAIFGNKKIMVDMP